MAPFALIIPAFSVRAVAFVKKGGGQVVLLSRGVKGDGDVGEEGVRDGVEFQIQGM